MLANPAYLDVGAALDVWRSWSLFGEQMQDALALKYEQRDGAFATLFTDVTDAWFEGRGPDMAERCRTKEGLPSRHKIVILLLRSVCRYPLRWCSLPGRARDGIALQHLVDRVEDEP